ncbi:MAG: glycosyltransferase family 39 protein, partial [Chloroflexi bacterium]|nr:glycosyltransferase family 39 protein [Chloroflexota bacterium]
MLALAGILALAAFLWLYGLWNGQYGSDDERLWSQALQALHQPSFPTSGINSSIGVGNGPAQVDLVIPAAALFPGAPIAGAIVVAAVNVAGVYFLFRLVDDFFGRRPALIAALLYAVSSWSIIYSRRMQGQDMLAAFEILFFWSAARWLASGRRRDVVAMTIWLAVLSQVYVLGLLHLIAAALVLVIGWRRLAWRPAIIALAAFLTLMAPYAITALLPAAGNFGGIAGSGRAQLNGDSLGLAVTMATHKGFQTIAGQAGSVIDATNGFELGLMAIEASLFVAGVIFAVVWLAGEIRQHSKDERSPKSAALICLLVWTGIPVALFARHAVPLYPYYFVSLLPLPAVFSAFILDRLWSKGGQVALAVLSANSVAL